MSRPRRRRRTRPATAVRRTASGPRPVTGGTVSADARDQLPETPARARTGPRHAAPKKSLFTRFQMPAGKAIAMAAMPTAVLMGMGFTPTLALADDQPSTSNSLKADEYKDCVAALEGDKDKDKDGASPSPSA